MTKTIIIQMGSELNLIKKLEHILNEGVWTVGFTEGYNVLKSGIVELIVSLKNAKSVKLK